MAETVTADRPSVARPRSKKAPDRQRVGAGAAPSIAAGPTSASSKSTALSSGKVAASRSIRAGLPTCDTCGERQQSDRTHAKAKTELLQIRIMEKRRELVPQDEVNEPIDDLCGVAAAL